MQQDSKAYMNMEMYDDEDVGYGEEGDMMGDEEGVELD